MSDVRFILTEDNYEIVIVFLIKSFSKVMNGFLNIWFLKRKNTKLVNSQYLNFINHKIHSKYFNVKILKDIVEKLVFAPGNRIFYLDSNNEMKGIITLTDLFDIYLDSFLEND